MEFVGGHEVSGFILSATRNHGRMLQLREKNDLTYILKEVPFPPWVVEMNYRGAGLEAEDLLAWGNWDGERQADLRNVSERKLNETQWPGRSGGIQGGKSGRKEDGEPGGSEPGTLLFSSEGHPRCGSSST